MSDRGGAATDQVRARPVACAALRRPLGALERGFWLMDAGAPLQFVVVAHVRGGLDTAVLRRALDALQARHPALRVGVQERDGWPHFEPCDDRRLELQVFEAPEPAWVARAEDELVARFPAEGPLMRACLLRHEPQLSTLLLTLAHVIGDGRSAVLLVRDLLEAAREVLAGREPELPPLGPTLPLEQLMPPAARGLRGRLRRSRLLLRSLWEARRDGPPVRVRRERDVPAHARRTRLLPTVLEPDVLEALVSRCRSERTTVHSALSAAMLLGILGDQPGSGAAAVSFGTAVDIRDRLEPSPRDALGLYASVCAYNRRVARDAGLWHLARALRRDVAARLGRLEDLSLTGLSPLLARRLGGGVLPPHAFVEAWERHAHGTSGLTNLGRLELAGSYGPLQLEACHVVHTPSALGDFVASAASMRSRLHWNFGWPDPDMSAEHARRLVDDIRGRLLSALGR